MPVKHTIRPGECISFLAYRNGFAIETIWKHPDNAALRERRASPYVLAPGDVVTIPDRTVKTVRCATGAKHVFRRRDVPERLRLRFLDDEGKPREGIPYEIEIAGARGKGKTDAGGWIESWIPPDATSGTLLLDGEEIELELGRLQPVSEAPGLQARLAALGYLPDPDLDQERAIAEALRYFQIDQGLDPTGEADEATRKTLDGAYSE